MKQETEKSILDIFDNIVTHFTDVTQTVTNPPRRHNFYDDGSSKQSCTHNHCQCNRKVTTNITNTLYTLSPFAQSITNLYVQNKTFTNTIDLLEFIDTTNFLVSKIIEITPQISNPVQTPVSTFKVYYTEKVLSNKGADLQMDLIITSFDYLYFSSLNKQELINDLLS